jgi:ADP-ribose pyrophosphatase YjhB (NUDIX family)
MLDYETDSYDGVIIKSKSLPATKDEFHCLLSRSLDVWKAAGKHGIWLKIPSSKLEFASVAAELGFVIHHGEKGYLMMTHWLSPNENKLPPNASHQVGVGCVVLNAEGKMLCVQEKNGPLKGMGVWKVPTGLADPQENLDEAARREVLEETGIETEFVGIMCFRQAHNFLFGKSDMFFVCLLKPTTTAIVKQESEIAACEWVDVEHYCQQSVFLLSPLHARLNAYIKTYVRDEEKTKVIFGQHTLAQGFRPGTNGLFLPDIITEVSEKIKRR